MKLDIYNQNGKKLSKKVDLNKDVFGINPSEHSVYLSVKSGQELVDPTEDYIHLSFFAN